MKKLLTAFRNATLLLDREAHLHVLHEEAEEEAKKAEVTALRSQAEIVETLMLATEDGTLLDKVRTLRHGTDETGVEALWHMVTADMAGLHRAVDLSTDIRRGQYLKVLEALLTVAHGELP